MKLANADLTSHNPVSTSTITAWHADVLTIESLLLHLDESNLNSAICKRKLYKNKINNKLIIYNYY